MPDWSVAEISDLSEKTFVITGATHGLGEAMAMALSARNATLVLGCRDVGAGEAVAERAGGNTRAAALDLADLRSVHSFANQVDTADVLINNAAVMATPHRLTTDGFESQFGTNHLGHFALTGLLLPKVTERIVTVSSFAHMWGRIDLDDLNFEHRKYNRWAAYGQAKLANLMFALELARRLRQAESPVSAMSAHPGYAVTNLIYHSENRILESIMRQGELMGQSAAQGARAPLYAATSPAAANGNFYGPRRFLYGAPRVARYRPKATDTAIARALWDISERLTGVSIVPTHSGGATSPR